MIFALVYSWLRLLVDVRLRVHNPEAELLLLRHQLRVVRRQVKRPQLNAADRTIMAALSQVVNRAALDIPRLEKSSGNLHVIRPGELLAIGLTVG